MKKGYATRLDYALETMKQIPYGKWRNHDPEDTVRFYSLRLHEVGMIKSSPQKIISQGTDWRIFKRAQKRIKSLAVRFGCQPWTYIERFLLR